MTFAELELRMATTDIVKALSGLKGSLQSRIVCELSKTEVAGMLTYMNYILTAIQEYAESEGMEVDEQLAEAMRLIKWINQVQL